MAEMFSTLGAWNWLVFGLPISLALLACSLLLTRLTLGRALANEPVHPVSLSRPAEPDDAARETRAGARWTIAAFALAFALWMAPSLAQGVLGRDDTLTAALGKHLPEAGVALLCAALLFVAPVSWKNRRFALTWAGEISQQTETLVTVSLRAVGDKTEMTLRHERLATAEMRRDHNGGWNSALNKLARHVRGETP